MKTLFYSKVFWFCVLKALAGALVVFSTQYTTAGWLIEAESGVSLILRFLTTTGVTITG